MDLFIHGHGRSNNPAQILWPGDGEGVLTAQPRPFVRLGKAMERKLGDEAFEVEYHNRHPLAVSSSEESSTDRD